MSGSQSPYQKPSDDDKTTQTPTVWEIMHESVNDNTPGFMYWLIRIGGASLICALFLGMIWNWMMSAG